MRKTDEDERKKHLIWSLATSGQKITSLINGVNAGIGKYVNANLHALGGEKP